MKELRTEIEIAASPEAVWRTLTDFASYPEWNPFIVRVTGKAEPGAQVDIAVASGSEETNLHCTLTSLAPNRELSWKYHVLMPWLFRGEHTFTIEPLGGTRVRFIDRETFQGLVVPLQAKDIDTQSRRGFEQMDIALKARSEHT